MNYATIIAFTVLLVLLYFLVSYLFFDSPITKLSNANQSHTIDSTRLKVSSNVNSSYSIWFYVKDWNSGYEREKVVFQRSGIKMALSPYVNDMVITINHMATSNNGPQSPSHECKVKNIPIQKWVNAIVSVNGKTADIYLNGKLVKTCLLPNVPSIDLNSAITITPIPHGFNGFTSRFRYYAAPMDPQKAWNIYKEGFGGGWGIFNYFSKYNIKVALLENNVEEASFTF